MGLRWGGELLEEVVDGGVVVETGGEDEADSVIVSRRVSLTGRSLDVVRTFTGWMQRVCDRTTQL